MNAWLATLKIVLTTWLTDVRNQQLGITRPPTLLPTLAPVGVTISSLEFAYTGEPQNFTAPFGVSQVKVTLYGAQGADTWTGPKRSGGYGAVISAYMPVTAGETYQIFVGGAGNQHVGGYNGGGNGKGLSSSCAGGGATDFRSSPYTLADRLLVAGGGGGASANCFTAGGNAGYPNGLEPQKCAIYAIGQPGTQSAGGAYGDNFMAPYYCTEEVNSGRFGLGGDACANEAGTVGYGGAGGGGYYGAGGAYGSSASGGSSYSFYAIDSVLDGSAAANSHVNGYAVVEYLAEPSTVPTQVPSGSSTTAPSAQTTARPTAGGNGQPTVAPGSNNDDSGNGEPSVEPSAAPTFAPNFFPEYPIAEPSAEPTAEPTLEYCEPSAAPTEAPTFAVETASTDAQAGGGLTVGAIIGISIGGFCLLVVAGIFIFVVVSSGLAASGAAGGSAAAAGAGGAAAAGGGGAGAAAPAASAPAAPSGSVPAEAV